MSDENREVVPDEAGPLPEPKRLHSPALDASLARISWEDIEADGVTTLEEMEELMKHRTLRSRFVAPVQTRWVRWRSTVRERRQRATRGWADRDWWSLDQHLCSHLGTLLVAMTDEGRTYPEAATYEEWMAEVRDAGEKLLAYRTTDRARVRDAQEALRWVAANLPSLWD